MWQGFIRASLPRPIKQPWLEMRELSGKQLKQLCAAAPRQSPSAIPVCALPASVRCRSSPSPPRPPPGPCRCACWNTNCNSSSQFSTVAEMLHKQPNLKALQEKWYCHKCAQMGVRTPNPNTVRAPEPLPAPFPSNDTPFPCDHFLPWRVRRWPTIPWSRNRGTRCTARTCLTWWWWAWDAVRTGSLNETSW